MSVIYHLHSHVCIANRIRSSLNVRMNRLHFRMQTNRIMIQNVKYHSAQDDTASAVLNATLALTLA